MTENETIQGRIEKILNERSAPRMMTEPQILKITELSVIQHQDIHELCACDAIGRPTVLFDGDPDGRSIIPSFEIARVISIDEEELDDETLSRAIDEAALQIAEEENDRLASLIGMTQRRKELIGDDGVDRIEMIIRTPITIITMSPGNLLIFEEIGLSSTRWKDDRRPKRPDSRFVIKGKGRTR